MLDAQSGEDRVCDEVPPQLEVTYEPAKNVAMTTSRRGDPGRRRIEPLLDEPPCLPGTEGFFKPWGFRREPDKRGEGDPRQPPATTAVQGPFQPRTSRTVKPAVLVHCVQKDVGVDDHLRSLESFGDLQRLGHVRHVDLQPESPRALLEGPHVA